MLRKATLKSDTSRECFKEYPENSDESGECFKRKWRKTEKSDESGECSNVNSENSDGLQECFKVGRTRCLWKSAVCNLLLSRIVILLLQFLSNIFIPDLPTDAFKFSGVGKDEFALFDRSVERFLEGLVRWDSVHFVNIALNGYIFENTLAFFPLFPAILRGLSTLVLLVVPIHRHTSIVVAGILLNNVCFVVTGMVLFKVVKAVRDAETTAFWAVVLFAWNPASIFFSSLYTESVYSLSTISALWLLYGQRSILISLIGSTLLFLISVGLRSNGLANAGYISYYVAVNIILVNFIALVNKPSLKNVLQYITKMVVVLLALLALLTIVAVTIRITGDRVAQHFCNTTTAHPDSAKLFAEVNGYVLQGERDKMPWCTADNRKLSIFPSYYNCIQKKYWNVEFFGYWQFRKLPCFLLAAPVLAAFILVAVDGFVHLPRSHSSLVDPFIPMFVHNLTMVGFGLTLFNVEILTRMLFSASPLLVIGLAQIAVRHLKLENSQFSEISFSTWKKGGPIPTLIYFYFVSYFVGGTILHANWGPFT